MFVFTWFPLDFTYDSLNYHFSLQTMLANQKTMLGIANIYGRYGFFSTWDYFPPIFKFLGNGFAQQVSFSLLVFPLLLLIYDFLFIKNLKLLFVRLLVLILFFWQILSFIPYGYESDMAQIIFSVIFVFVFLFDKLKKDNDIDYGLLSVIAAMAMLMKFNAFPLVVFLLIFYVLENYKNLKLKNILSLLLPLLGAFFIIFFVNALRSGCGLYPLAFSCYNVFPWVNAGQAEFAYQAIKAFDKEPFIGLASLMGYPWWKANLLKNIIIPYFKYFLPMIILIFVSAYFLIPKKRIKYNGLLLLSFLLTLLVVTLITSGIRTWVIFSSVITSFSLCLFFDIKDKEKPVFVTIFSVLVGVFISFNLLLFFRKPLIMFYHKGNYNNYYLESYNKSFYKPIKVLRRDGYSFYNIYTELCDEVAYCGSVSSRHLEKKKIFSYDYFTFVKLDTDKFEINKVK